VKQTSEVLGAMQVNDITEIEELDSFNIQNCAPFGGKLNVLVKLKSDMTR